MRLNRTWLGPGQDRPLPGTTGMTYDQICAGSVEMWGDPRLPKMEKAVIEAAFGYGVSIWLPMADIDSHILISGTIATGTTNPFIAFVLV